jgi:hypothetical protein
MPPALAERPAQQTKTGAHVPLADAAKSLRLSYARTMTLLLTGQLPGFRDERNRWRVFTDGIATIAR